MRELTRNVRPWLMLSAGVAALLAVPVAAGAQTAPASDAKAAADSTVVVVTGFRSSLRSALALKKNSAGTVDAIMAEDIAKFPDSNLAESMQRIPGVTLARGDGGEGRNISVRGLGPTFTRVRINGMEGAAQTGASDIYGAANSGRSFDFNVFPTDIFSSLAARKTPSADVEEGSLGATVDLKAPKPFDYHGDQVFSVTARESYNEVSKSDDPRFSVLASKKFGNGFGILGSFSYQHRHLREVGYSAVDILSVGSGNGMFCSPVGYAPQTPANSAAKGTDANNCATGDPRTSTPAAYNTVAALTSPLAPSTPGSGAFVPRIPRYFNSTQDASRLGGTLSFQWKPDANTDVSLDLLFTRYTDERRDNYIEAISFGRSISNNGQPMTSVKDVKFTPQGSLLYGLFDGVDVRSEGLLDRFHTTFGQANLNFMHRFNDRFEVSGMIGQSHSELSEPTRLQTYMDAIDTPNFSLDFGGNNRGVPTEKFGFDVDNVNNFKYQPGLSDGTVLGGFSTQAKPYWEVTVNRTETIEGKYIASDHVDIRAGFEARTENYNAWNLTQIPTQIATQSGVNLANVVTHITGLDSLWGHGAPSSWVAIDPDKWWQAVGGDNFKYCGVECGAGKSQIKETTNAVYLMSDFHIDHWWLPVPVRGDIGVRYLETNQLAVGYIPVAAPAGSTYPTVGQRNEVDRSYHDALPSANVVFDLKPDLLLRMSAAKVLARPDLGSLTPSSGVNPITRTGTINNPYLDPIKANTFDASLEWYFKPGSLLSAGYFYKDISSYIQKVTSQIPFNQLGLPNALLDGTNTAPTEVFTVTRSTNTPGGPLKGIELNLQTDMFFLPGLWKNFGVLANYTHVASKINYVLTSSNGVVTSSTTNDLVGLSPDSASATIYYEDKNLSLRTTGTYRSRYIRGIPASFGSDLQGNAPTFYLDASASYNLSPHLKIILDAQNLTDEENRLYIDSSRQDTLFQSRVGRTFTLGVSYKY